MALAILLIEFLDPCSPVAPSSRLAAAFLAVRPENPSAVRIADGRPDWPGTGPPALRAVPRRSALRKYRRNHDQRPRCRRDAAGKVHPRQGMRAHQHVAVQFTSATASWQATAAPGRQAARAAHPDTLGGLRPPQWTAAVASTVISDDPAEIEEQRKVADRPGARLPGATAHVRRPFQLRPSLIDQIETDMRGA